MARKENQMNTTDRAQQGNRIFWTVLLLLVWGTVSSAADCQGKIDGALAYAWPNGRTVGNNPSEAVDGDLSTYTWTTNPFTNDQTNYLGLAFPQACDVNMIRWWRDRNCGSGGQPGWECAKNLVVQYTIDSGPMENRAWLNVTQMSNSVLEPVSAESVNLDGTIELEFHDSSTEGWASVVFARVVATGMRIGFSRTEVPQFYENNHYKVHEIEAYNDIVAVEAASWTLIKSMYAD
jgi:hypothetical protein